MHPDPAWQGPIQFHELLFGFWLAYGVVFSVVYIIFERSAREIVSTGIHESWVLGAAFIGCMAVVIVRGRQLYSADR